MFYIICVYCLQLGEEACSTPRFSILKCAHSLLSSRHLNNTPGIRPLIIFLYRLRIPFNRPPSVLPRSLSSGICPLIALFPKTTPSFLTKVAPIPHQSIHGGGAVDVIQPSAINAAKKRVHRPPPPSPTLSYLVIPTCSFS